MDKTDRTDYILLLNNDGQICGISDLTSNKSKADTIRLGEYLLQKISLYDGYHSKCKFNNRYWMVEVKEIHDISEQFLYFMVIIKSMVGLETATRNTMVTKLENKNTFYEKIINNSCDEIFVTDGHGKIIFANPISESHYGIPISEMIGKSVWELEERGVYYPAITPMVLREKKKITIDQETAVGKRLMLTATPVFDKNGSIEMVICNSRDVTALEDMKNSYHDIKKKVHKSLASVANGHREEDNYNQLIYAYNSSIAELVQMSEKVAKTESVVLLQGETGTGKDLFARQIHDSSKRKDKQYVKINCAALPQELLESELFGYKSGAFTGASPKGKIGQFSLADGGTILLDEIGEMPLSLQPKLLQVIEEQKFTPIGSHTVEKVNVRIIASTNKDLREMIEKGAFREDLYYRICVLPITIPPLRSRKVDVPLLIDHYLKIFNAKHKRKLELSPEARNIMVNYDWPGNVRELKHLTELLTVTTTSLNITPEQLPQHIATYKGFSKETNVSVSQNQPLLETLSAVEKEIVRNSYQKLKSSYKVARDLGISQSSATRKIRKYIRP